MAEEMGVFETIHSMRAMRRLKPDPVQTEMIRKILDAGIRAPSGQNLQAWAFVVLQEPDNKQFFQERYHQAMLDRFGDAVKVDPSDKSPWAKTVRAAMHLAEHMHEAPVLLLICGKAGLAVCRARGKARGQSPAVPTALFTPACRIFCWPVVPWALGRA